MNEAKLFFRFPKVSLGMYLGRAAAKAPHDPKVSQ